MRRRLLLTSPLAFVAACDRASTSAPAVASAPVAASAPTVTVPTEPPLPRSNFDSNVANIALKELNITAREVYLAASDIVQPKGKYESTAEFGKRMGDLKSKFIFEKAVLGGTFAFDVSTRVARFTYNPDKEQFAYEVSPKAGGNHEFNLIELERRPVDGAAFAGQDAYFASRGKAVDHAAVVCAQVEGMKGLTYVTGVAKVPRSKAEAIEKWLQVLLVGDLRPPYVRSDTRYPFDQNENTIEHLQILVMNVQGYWLIDSRDGTILTKQSRMKKF